MGKDVDAPVTISRRELLEKYREIAAHNLLCFSKNYAMSEPEAGFEDEWSRCQAECELLDDMIRELKKDEIVDRGGIPGWRPPEVLEEKKPLQDEDCEEARRYVEDILVGEKGLRLVDVAKLMGCNRTEISKFLRQEKNDWLTLQVLAFKKRLEGSVAVDE